MWPFAAVPADTAAPTATEITAALEQTPAPTAAELTVKKEEASVDGKVKCQTFGTGSVTFTAAGWAAPADDTDSGAKTLAAAFAAGALTIAATQF